MTIRSNNYWESELPIDFFPTARGDGKHYLNGKSGPAAPPPPDYAKIAETQGAANVETARTEGKINNPNMYTPYGTRNVSWDGDVPTVTDTLTPEGQTRFDQENRIIGQIGNVAEHQVGRVGQAFGQPFDFSGLSPQVGNIGYTNRFGPAPAYQSPIGQSPQYGQYNPGGNGAGGGSGGSGGGGQPPSGPNLGPMPTMPVMQQRNLPPSHTQEDYPTLYEGGPPTLDQYTEVIPGRPEVQASGGEITGPYGARSAYTPYQAAIPEQRNVDQAGYDAALAEYNQQLTAAQKAYNEQYYAPSAQQQADFDRRQAEYEAALAAWEAQRDAANGAPSQQAAAPTGSIFEGQPQYSAQPTYQTMQQQAVRQQAAQQQAPQQTQQQTQQQPDPAFEQAKAALQPPPLTALATAPQVQTGLGQTPIQYDAGDAGQIQRQVDRTPVKYNIGDAGQIQGAVGGQQYQTQIGDAGQLQRALGNTPGPQYGINDVGGPQRALGSTPGPRYSIGDVGGPQRAVDFSGAPQLPGVNDFSADRRRVEEALMSRVGEDFDRRQEQLKNQLIQKGFSAGTEGFDQEMKQLERARNDANFNALMAGGQEQSRLFGLGSSARAQYTGEELAGGQFGNQAQGQAFGQSAAQQQAYNAAAGQQFGQGLAGMQAINQAQGQAFGQSAAQQQAYNAAANQQFAQQMGEATFGNQTQQQAYDQLLGLGMFGNQARAQQFGQGLQQGQFANAAQAQRFGELAQRQGAYNAAAGQEFGQNMGAGQFGNAAQAQQFGELAQRQGAFNAASGQQFGQDLASGQFGNQAVGQQYGMNSSEAAARNALTQNNWQNQLTGMNQGLAMDAQNFNMQQQAAMFQNAARQQQIQEQSFARNLALNEMNAARSGAPVQMPQFTQYTGGAQIAPPPIAQAAQQQQQYNQSVYNAQAAQTAAQNAGAYQLGGAALGAGAMMYAAGAFSDARLKSDIVPRGTLGGINIYEYTINGVPNQLGVIAQELAPVMPQAVFTMPNGFLGVNYGMLIEHWRSV